MKVKLCKKLRWSSSVVPLLDSISAFLPKSINASSEMTADLERDDRGIDDANIVDTVDQ